MADVNRENWMTDQWERLKGRLIYDVILPATHNSGIYSWLNSICVRNQTEGILAQLKGGVRGFDIRVTKSGDGPYLMHHNGYVPFDGSQQLEPALQELKDFATAHPKEILVVRLDPACGTRLVDTPEERAKLRKKVLDYLESRLVWWDPGLSYRNNYTLENIHSGGKNIIVFSSYCRHQEPDHFWVNHPENPAWLDNTYLYAIQGHRPGMLPEAQVAELKPHLERYLQRRPNPRQFLYMDCSVYNIFPGVVANAGLVVHPALCNWLDEWSNRPAWLNNLNIVAIDNFLANGSAVVDKLIALNRRLSQLEPARQPVLMQAKDVAMAGAPDLNDMPHFRDQDSFSEADTRKAVAALGLDWDKYEREYNSQGKLNEASLVEFERKGVPRAVVEEYVKWHEATHAATV